MEFFNQKSFFSKQNSSKSKDKVNLWSSVLPTVLNEMTFYGCHEILRYFQFELLFRSHEICLHCFDSYLWKKIRYQILSCNENSFQYKLDTSTQSSVEYIVEVNVEFYAPWNAKHFNYWNIQRFFFGSS